MSSTLSLNDLSNVSARTPLTSLLKRLIQRWEPHQIWLFGSRARGDHRPNSDWDLFVVVPDTTAESELDPELAWLIQRDLPITADVILCRSADFREFFATPNSLSHTVAQEGILLYERRETDRW